MKQDKTIYRLVKEIADMAEHASLTGSLDSGRATVIQRYNALVETLEDENEIPHGLFSKLGDSAEYGQIAVEARLLASALKGSSNGDSPKGGDLGVVLRLAPFVASKDLTDMVKVYVGEGGRIDPNTLTALAPFLESGALSELVRGYIVKVQGGPGPVSEVQTPKPPSAPAQPAPPTQPQTPTPVPPREAVVGNQDLIDQITDELVKDDVSPERRKALVEKLKALTQKASQLPG